MQAKKGIIYNDAVEKIRSGNAFTDDIMRKFLNIAGQSLRTYTITSKKKNVEQIYKQCHTDADFYPNAINLAESILYSEPKACQIDVAVTMLNLIELARHDKLMMYVNDALQKSGFSVLAYDKQIKDVFPEVNSILTPDIFFKKDKDKYILELKVRNERTDLSWYYNRYTQAVANKSIKVSVFNVSPSGFIEFGDYNLTNLIDIDPDMISDVTYCIDLCKKLREKYNTFPEFSFYQQDQMHSDECGPFIDSGFKKSCLDNANYKEIKSLFGSRWESVEDDMDNLSLMTNASNTTDVLLDANKSLYQDCINRYPDFIEHLNDNYLSKDTYNPTNLQETNLVKKLDDKNSAMYHITKKSRPSIYIPIAKTVFMEGGDRLKFYKRAFVGITSRGDQYTKSVINLTDTIFNSIAIDLIITKDKDIDPVMYKDVLTPEFCMNLNDNNVRFKKIAMVSGITSDTTILNNNSFSINHYVDRYMKENIMGYKNKHYDPEVPKKECMSIKDSEEDLIDLLKLMKDLFETEHHPGIYANDLVHVDNDNMNNNICDLPESCRTKYLEHLYVQHVVFKALISLNTTNSHKFRLIQTNDPCTILIMLPNSDSIGKCAPLRYFTLTIIDKKDTTSYPANKLLGIAHDLLIGQNYNVILSKVISLDVTRLKLLNHSFGKYCLIMTYYSNIKQRLKHHTHFLIWILCQFVTISSLTITDTYKNFIMAIYSDYSNIDNLIDDKLESRPTTLGQIYVLQKCFEGINNAVKQLKTINKNKNSEDIDERGELIGTGFNDNLSLKLPISNLSVNNPKEIIHEAFMLFYLGNKGLHGSPQELLKLYYVPYKFEKEYKDVLSMYNTVLQEEGNTSNMSFSYDVLRKTSLVAYANLYNKKDNVRKSICSELDFDKPLLSLKQFSSTKSMVSNCKINYVERPSRLRDDTDIHTFEQIVNESIVHDEIEFIKFMNSEVYRINAKRLREESQSKKPEGKRETTLLPELLIEDVKGVKFIKMRNLEYSRSVTGDYVKQGNVKVFDEFFRLSEEYSLLNVKDAYKQLIHDDELMIRIFYKDQRTADDREIYTGNAQTRLCLYPIEKTYKAICKHIPGEAITISGDQKQKKLLEQRLSLIKEKRQKIRDKKSAEIYSVSSDASKWSARDIFLKFIVTISTNPYLHPDEKWFLLFLCLRYYKKNIVLTDTIFNRMIRLVKNDKSGIYEEMTNNYLNNSFEVRSNWLQGNLNMISSFVHHCSTIYTETMLKIYCDKQSLECNMTSMVHSDDSTYDFLICTGSQKHQRSINNKYTQEKNIGKLIIALITFSNRFHCITLNEKKTYISTFYKEFLSTIIVGNELFFFYLADLLPLTSDTSYSSPLQDLASYSGYINNAFSHACPLNMIKTAVTLINHFTLSTYNMHYTATKNPRQSIDSSDLPIQIYPRYKLPLSLAGMIPYYSADAFNILNDVISKMDKFGLLKNELVEDILTEELLHEYIGIITRNCPKVLKYLKACILCMDYTQYERDDADPYNIIDYDLSQKSIINVVSLNKAHRLKKTYTYKKYLENEKSIRLQSAIHPEWCVVKPVEPELIKANILQNYTNPNFRDGLIFSTPAMDYGRRVINSNKNMYTISSHVMEKDSKKNISTVYSDLAKKIDEIEVTARDLQRYLSIYLLSDKKVSMAVQVYYSKVETITMPKPAYNKVIQPRSVYAEDFGRYSNTSLIESLLTSRYCKITTVDPKVDKFIHICEYVLERVGDIKLYQFPEDIDEDYTAYYKFKYPSSSEVTIDVDPIHDFDELGLMAYNNKIKFMSLLIKYFIDINKSIDDPKYNIPNYPSPSSIVMTIDSMLKKDDISSKVYLSNIKSTKYDDYLLTRYGMYTYNDFHVKYKLGYKIKIASSGKLSNNLQLYRDTYEPLAFVTKLIARDSELFEDLKEHDEFMTGHYKFNDMLKILQNSKDMNSTALLLMLGKMSTYDFMKSLFADNRVYNHWVVPTNSVPEDPGASLAYYLCQGQIVKVRTLTQNGLITFSMTHYRYFYKDQGALDSIKKKIASDYVELLREARKTDKVHSTSKHEVFNVNEFGRQVNYINPLVKNVCPIIHCKLVDIKPDYIENEGNMKLILTVKTDSETFDFVIRLRSYIEDGLYLEYLTQNIHIEKDSILSYLCESTLFHKYPEHLEEHLMDLSPNQLLSLMENNSEFPIITELIDHKKYGFISQYSNYFENNNNPFMASVCKALQNVALETNVNVFEERNPERFIKSCNRRPHNQDCHELVIQRYRANEKIPYYKLFTLIMKYRHMNHHVEKIILFVILIFRFYIEDYINLDDDLEY